MRNLKRADIGPVAWQWQACRREVNLFIGSNVRDERGIDAAAIVKKGPETDVQDVDPYGANNVPAARLVEVRTLGQPIGGAPHRYRLVHGGADHVSWASFASAHHSHPLAQSLG
jgi:hypothetical protein